MFIFFRHKNNDTQKEFNQKIGEIYQKLSEKSFSKFVEVIASPRQIFWRSFLAGIARGIGTAIGFSILGALLIYLFRYIIFIFYNVGHTCLQSYEH